MFPIQITLRDIYHASVKVSESALEMHIRKKAEKLHQYYNRIVFCRVVVEFSQKHKHQGKLFNIRIDIKVPGKNLLSTRKSNEDIYIALRDAFAALNRKLRSYAHKRCGTVKHHEDVLHGRIVRLILDEGYGFIEGADGNEYYFSLTNVSYPDFKHLMIGDEVGYLPEAVDEGWQAHRVVKEHYAH